jgi:hypothetical protein
VAGDGGPCGGAHDGAGGSTDDGSWSSSWWLSGAPRIEGSQNGGGSIKGVPERWRWRQRGSGTGAAKGSRRRQCAREIKIRK